MNEGTFFYPEREREAIVIQIVPDPAKLKEQMGPDAFAILGGVSGIVPKIIYLMDPEAQKWTKVHNRAKRFPSFIKAELAAYAFRNLRVTVWPADVLILEPARAPELDTG